MFVLGDRLGTQLERRILFDARIPFEAETRDLRFKITEEFSKESNSKDFSQSFAGSSSNIGKGRYFICAYSLYDEFFQLFK